MTTLTTLATLATLLGTNLRHNHVGNVVNVGNVCILPIQHHDYSIRNHVANVVNVIVQNNTTTLDYTNYISFWNHIN